MHFEEDLQPPTASLVAQIVNNLPAIQEIHVQSLGRGFHGEGNGYPHQYSCLGNVMESGDWQAAVHGGGVGDGSKSQT